MLQDLQDQVQTINARSYQRAASTGELQSDLSARSGVPSNSPTAARSNPSAMSSRVTQPTYAAPVSSRPAAAPRATIGAASTADGETRGLEVAKLGLMVRDDAVATVSHQSSRPPRGVLVLKVLVGSGGDAAGIESGDRLLAVNGRLVNQAEPLVDLVDQIAPGEPVELKFNRAGKLYSTVGLASGPTGKLDKDEFAIVRQQAREMLGEVAATQGELPMAKGNATNETSPNSSSTLSGLGNALGSWLGSAASKPKAQSNDAEQTAPDASEPNARNVDAPAAAKDKEYKSLRPSVVAIAASGLADSDPPSLENDASLEGAGDRAMDVAETLPAPPPVTEEATIEQLLKEIRLLRERIQQLETQSRLKFASRRRKYWRHNACRICLSIRFADVVSCRRRLRRIVVQC